MAKNRLDRDFIDPQLVMQGDLSGLSDSELCCYYAGQSAGIELALRCGRISKWRSRRIWDRIWNETRITAS